MVKGKRREWVQRILARCYVALAEIDYDLAKWRDETTRPTRETRP